MASWDWEYATPYWELKVDRYISAPSSLAVKFTTALAVLSRFGPANHLSTGGLSSWFYRHGYYWGTQRIGFTFRNQAELGTSNNRDCYHVSFEDRYEAALRRRVNNVQTLIGTWAVDWQNTTWKRYMVTWWNGYDQQNTPSLVARLQEWNGTGWNDKGELYDPQNQWADSIRNRTGIYLAQDMNYADNTAIWLPAAG